MICPKCGSDKVYPSRLKNDNEYFIAMVTGFDPYRCMTCQHRWWKFHRRGRKPDQGDSKLPDLKKEYQRLRHNVRTFWPENRGRLIPLAFKLIVLAAVAIGIAALLAYSMGRIKPSVPDYAKPTKAIK